MPEVKLSVKPTLKELKERLKKAREYGANTFLPHKKIAIFLDRWVQINFKKEGGKVGGWKEFALGGRKVVSGKRKTKTGKTINTYKLDKSAKLLQDTGRLRNSFVPFADKRDAGIWSDLEYAAMHHYGLKHVPERRLLPKKEEVLKDIRQIYEQHFSNTKKVLKND